MGHFDELYDLKPSLFNRQKRRDKRLHEELIECGRYNGGRRHKKGREEGRKKLEQLLKRTESEPVRENMGMLRKVGRRTFLSDNLEPLERWLAAQLGRPWDTIYSELGKIVNPDSVHGIHIREHLWEYVTTKCRMDEAGNLVIAEHSGEPVAWPEMNRMAGDYLVHPVSGMLQKMPSGKAEPRGPFPKKARWKKEKQRNRFKIRQGLIPPKTTAPAGVDLATWPCIRTRNKRLEKCTLLDIRWGAEVFRAAVNAVDIWPADKRRSDSFRDLFLKLHVRSVFSGGTIKEGEVLNLKAREHQAAKWTVFEENRLF